MALGIGSNISSLQAQRRLSENSSVLARTYERLSTGQRINRASDDAAGLAISDSLRAQSTLYTAAQRNINDALSASNIMESALGRQQAILNRLSELAEQSANGVYANGQRVALNKEYRALVNEINRISATTRFNGISLLAGSRDGNTPILRMQAGVDGNLDSQISLQSADTGFLSGTVGVLQSTSPQTRTFVNSSDTIALRNLIFTSGSLDSVSALCAGAIAATSVKDSSGAERDIYVAHFWGYGSPAHLDYGLLSYAFYQDQSGRLAEAGFEIDRFPLGGAPAFKSAVSLTFVDTNTTAALSLDYAPLSMKQLANGPVDNSALDFTGVETAHRAKDALVTVANRRSEISLIQGEIGAMQSRFNAALNVASISGTNTKAAESRIRDADIAEESGMLVRTQILQRVASSVLAQANQAPALALQLLRNG